MSDNKKRYIFFWLYIFVSKVLALLVIGIQYDLFRPKIVDIPGGVTTQYKWSIWVILLLVWFVFTFWENTTVFIRDMEEGIFREILQGVNSLMLPLILWGSGVVAFYFLKDYLFFTGTILVTSLLGVVFRALHNYYRRRVLLLRGYVNVLK